jgi:cytochrome c peroxidase
VAWAIAAAACASTSPATAETAYATHSATNHAAARASIAALRSSAGLGLPPPTAALRAWPPQPLQAELGRRLFFDRRLSFNGTMSCGMCHVPEEGFASNASQQAVGIEGRSLKRNTPTVLNVAWLSALFLDGRENSLQTQAWAPLLHADEMANPSVGHLLERLRRMPDYAGRFERAFGGRGPTMDTVGAALAAYQRTLVAGDSRFDRWRYAGQVRALSAEEQRGFALFIGTARCATCHLVGERDALFTDERYHVTGAGAAWQPRQAVVVPLAPGVQTTLGVAERASFDTGPVADLGRWEITLDPADRHAFRTPSLRNVARTAPYMHDGSLPTLEAVVDFYAQGGGPVADRSQLLTPQALDGAQRRALVAFLRALDSAALPELVRHARQPFAAGSSKPGPRR